MVEGSWNWDLKWREKFFEWEKQLFDPLWGQIGVVKISYDDNK